MKTFFKKLEYIFSVGSSTTWHVTIFTKLSSRKPMLRQIEWVVQDEPITKSEVLTITTLFFWKFCFSSKTWNKESIWCTNHLNVYIHTFWRCWSFIWGCFFPVSILNTGKHFFLQVPFYKQQKQHRFF